MKTIENSIFRNITIAMSIIVILFSISVLIGWYAHIDALIRYKEDTIAIVFNTALSFMLTAIAILCLVYKKNKLARTLIIIVATLSGLVLIQHILDIDLGIDELFYTHYDSLGNKFPGRMAPNTTLCFMLASISISLYVLSLGKFHKHGVLISGMLSLVILTFSVVFISGYLSEIQHAYLWGSITPMSTTAAVGFTLLAINLISLNIYEAKLRKILFLRYLPYATVLCILMATLILVTEIGELEQTVHHTASVQIITLILGVALSIIFGVLLYLFQAVFYNSLKLKHSVSLLNSTIEATMDGIAVFDLNGELIIFNSKFIKMWGLEGVDMAVQNRRTITAHVVKMVKDNDNYYAKRKFIQMNPTQNITDQLKLKNGTILERHVSPQYVDGKIIGKVCSYTDITEQVKLEQQLMHQTTHDILTELPNRTLMTDLINRAIASAARSFSSVAILLIDIDKFSQINDLYGRSKADLLLKRIAIAINKAIPANCTLGRIGGDEFLLLSPELIHEQNAVQLINKVMRVFDEPFELYGKSIMVSCCIGGAFYPKDGEEVDVLLANADVAVLRSKKNGKSNFEFYTQDMKLYSIQHIQLEQQLIKAIKQNEFVVYYQPIFDLKTKLPVGVEALTRWINSKGEVILPAQFITFAEENGMITDLGKIVLLEACRQASEWQKQGFNDLTIAVNISAHQFRNEVLVNALKDAIYTTDINPKNLELELTESVFIKSVEEVSEMLREVLDLGIKISIDDFGTGYSSFNYVKQFLISKVKIDRMFIVDSVKSEQDQAILSAMIEMSKKLRFTILAEGVETIEQSKLLESLGCDQVQGFYYAKPMPAAECTAFLKSFQYPI